MRVQNLRRKKLEKSFKKNSSRFFDEDEEEEGDEKEENCVWFLKMVIWMLMHETNKYFLYATTTKNYSFPRLVEYLLLTRFSLSLSPETTTKNNFQTNLFTSSMMKEVREKSKKNELETKQNKTNKHKERRA